MKYSQYRDEQKAFGKISGFWTWIAYMMRYRAKETFAFLVVILLAWIVTIIMNPSIAEHIRSYFLQFLK